MVTKRKFNRIKRENPESRIGQRTWEEQKVRNDLAKTLIKAKKKGVETPLDGYIDEKIKLKKEKEVWENEKENRENEKQKILEDIKMLKEQYDKCLGEINEIKKKKAYEMLDNLEQNIDSLSYPEMLRSLNKIKDSLEQVIKSNRPDNFEELKGNPDKLIADLKENHMKVDENVEMYGYKGKIVHVELPSVGGFKGYKFDYFISDDPVQWKDDYENKNNEDNINFHTKWGMCEFLNNLNRYMQEFGISLDQDSVHDGGQIEYQYRADCRSSGKRDCRISEYVKDLFNWHYAYIFGPHMLFIHGEQDSEDFFFYPGFNKYHGKIVAKIDKGFDDEERENNEKMEMLIQQKLEQKDEEARKIVF